MNCMKKLLKNKYLIFSIIILLIMFIIFVLIKRNNNKQILLIYPKEHYVLSKTDDPCFNLDIYSDKEDSEYLNINIIDNIQIYNNINQDYITTKVKEIIKTDEYIEYEKKKYYKNSIIIELPISKNTVMNIENADIKINYKTDKSINLYLGSINIIEYQSDNSFIINRMKGLVNKINSQDSIIGIYMQLYNNTENDIIITNIEYTSNTIISNYDYIKKVEEINESNNELINEVLKIDYNIYQQSNNKNCNFNINKNEQIKLFIPLTYLKDNVVNQTGIIIKYIKDNQNYQQIIEPFIFFNSLENKFEVSKVVIDQD